MVEAPGTAPGSDGFITKPVYRYSRAKPTPLYTPFMSGKIGGHGYFYCGICVRFLIIELMQTYLTFLRHVLEEGVIRDDRTGTGTKSIFGYQMRFDLQAGFPLLTTKKLHMKSIIYELLWFLSGDTNIAYLKQNGVSIWDEWADENGDLGPVYGKQWRSWPDKNGETIDQITRLVAQLKNNPNSRRHIVTAWNPQDIDSMALPPCHCLFQFFVAPDDAAPAGGRLSCQLYQRSADIFLGVPFNIASYALLTHMVAQICGFSVGEFIHSFGDAHLYLNHTEQAKEQLKRIPRAPPRLIMNRDVTDLFSFRYEDFHFENYDPHPHIAAPVAV